MKGTRAAFFAAEGVLYALFMIGDLGGLWPTTGLKFAAIALVAAAGLRAGREHRFTAVALGLTLLADLFLLVLDCAYALGVALFLAVQVCYALRLARSRGQKATPALLLRVVPALLVALLTARWGLLTALPAAYICVFAVNLLDGLPLAAAHRERPAFALGLLLFFCCDLCVGAHNLPAALLPMWLPGFAAVAMWGFYLPGQVLILASTGALRGEKT